MSCEASIRPSKAPSSLGKRPRNISSSPLQVGSRRKKSGRSQKSALLSPKSSRFSPLILAHKVSALPWLVDGRATPHHRLVLTQSNSTCNNTCASCGTLPGSLRQSHLPLAYHTLPKDTTLVFGRGAPGVTTQTQPNCQRLSIDGLNRVDRHLMPLVEGKSGFTPAGKTLPTHARRPSFGHVCMVITYSRVWVNQVKFSTLLVVS